MARPIQEKPQGADLVKVENIMTSTVFCVGSGQSLNEAAQLMWEHNCGSLPVVDEDNQIVGMLTDRDIAMAAYPLHIRKSLSAARRATTSATFNT